MAQVGEVEARSLVVGCTQPNRLYGEALTVHDVVMALVLAVGTAAKVAVFPMLLVVVLSSSFVVVPLQTLECGSCTWLLQAPGVACVAAPWRAHGVAKLAWVVVVLVVVLDEEEGVLL